ncbi:MAG: universal stress protein [Gammaproteobacteria bacterium]|nr:universal stress protein [Gammaproteobacteria bacterium]
MSKIHKIFAVIDPTTDKQAALITAELIASQDSAVALHVYEAIFATTDNIDIDALQRVELSRHRAWVESLVAPIRIAGNEVTVEVEWTKEWRDAIAPAAERAGADLIVKEASSHSGAGRRLLKTSDWTLLRNSHCPVYLVKNESIEAGAKVLVALDMRRDDDLHNRLNEQVLSYGRALVANIPDASLHAVTAYPNSDNFVYPSDLAEKAGIEINCAHAIEGSPESVIAEVAQQTAANIVIIGTAAREGIKAAVIGNTVEKILDAVDSNILTVNAG